MQYLCDDRSQNSSRISLLAAIGVDFVAGMLSSGDVTEYKSPFWIPFLIALGIGAVGSMVMIWLRLGHGYHSGLLLILIGVLCGWGTRLGDGDFSSAIVALAVLQFSTLLIIGSVEIARETESSVIILILEVFKQGKFTGFLNDCLSNFIARTRSVQSIGFAYLAAFGVYRIGKD